MRLGRSYLKSALLAPPLNRARLILLAAITIVAVGLAFVVFAAGARADGPYYPGTAVLSATVSGLDSDKTYRTRINAYNGEGASGWAYSNKVNLSAPSFGLATVDDQVWTVGTAIESLTLPTATGGTAPLIYSLTPALPGSGLSFNTGTRVLSGTLDTSQGKLAYTLTVTDNDGSKDTLSFNISVLPATPPLTPGAGQRAGDVVLDDRRRPGHRHLVLRSQARLRRQSELGGLCGDSGQ